MWSRFSVIEGLATNCYINTQTMQAIETSATFTRQTGSFGGIDPGPLVRAREWAEQRQLQMLEPGQLGVPMLLLAEEMPKPNSKDTWRRYHVVELTTFLARKRVPNEPMFTHEIVPSECPCKFGFDLECGFGDDEHLAKAQTAFGVTTIEEIVALCERAKTQLIAHALAKLSVLVGRSLNATEHVVVLHGTRPGKWSIHIIFDGSDANNDSIVFRSSNDCCAFAYELMALPELVWLANVCETLPVVDLGIYASNHPLRHYFSSKRSAPNYHLCTTEHRNVPLDPDIMRRSLLTCFITRTYTGRLYHQADGGARAITSLLVSMSPDAFRVAPIQLESALVGVRRTLGSSMSRSGSMVVQGASYEALGDALCRAKELADYEPVRIKVQPNNTVLIVCRGLMCHDADRGEHSDTHRGSTYLIVDLLRGEFVQLCHSTNCIAKRKDALSYRRALGVATLDAVHAYLARDWSGSTCIGDEVVEALGHKE